MIDLHCHLVFGVDDGPKSIDTSIEMIRMAHEQGFSAIFSTPHFIDGEFGVDRQVLVEHINEINSRLLEEGICFDIYVGNEVFVSRDIAELVKNGSVCTLNDSRYLLFELPMSDNVLYLEEVIFELVSLGYVPIIAHPERYDFVQKNIDCLVKLIDMGSLIQVNMGSIIGLYGRKAKRTVKLLLKRNMVHFLASDAHSLNGVYTRIPKILKKIVKIVGSDKLKELTEINPKCVVYNYDIGA